MQWIASFFSSLNGISERKLKKRQVSLPSVTSHHLYSYEQRVAFRSASRSKVADPHCWPEYWFYVNKILCWNTGKIALALQAFKMLRVLYSLSFFNKGRRYSSLTGDALLQNEPTPESCTFPVRESTSAILKLRTSHIGILIWAKFLEM